MMPVCRGNILALCPMTNGGHCWPGTCTVPRSSWRCRARWYGRGPGCATAHWSLAFCPPRKVPGDVSFARVQDRKRAQHLEDVSVAGEPVKQHATSVHGVLSGRPLPAGHDGCVQIRPIWRLFGRRARPRVPKRARLRVGTWSASSAVPHRGKPVSPEIAGVGQNVAAYGNTPGPSLWHGRPVIPDHERERESPGSSSQPGCVVNAELVRPGKFGGRYICELLVSLPDSSAL